MSRRLDRFDILRSWAFWTLPWIVGHSLSLLKFFVAHSLNVRHVEEHVVVGSGFDKTKTLVRQPLDRAFCHLQSNSKKVFLRRCPTRLVQAAPPHGVILTGGVGKTRN